MARWFVGHESLVFVAWVRFLTVGVGARVCFYGFGCLLFARYKTVWYYLCMGAGKGKARRAQAASLVVMASRTNVAAWEGFLIEQRLRNARLVEYYGVTIPIAASDDVRRSAMGELADELFRDCVDLGVIPLPVGVAAGDYQMVVGVKAVPYVDGGVRYESDRGERLRVVERSTGREYDTFYIFPASVLNREMKLGHRKVTDLVCAMGGGVRNLLHEGVGGVPLPLGV